MLRFPQRKDGASRGRYMAMMGVKKSKAGYRQILVDIQGLLLGVLVSEANMGERLGATGLVMEQAENISYIELIWADSGFCGPKFQLAFAERCLSSIANLILAQVEIVKRNSKGFEAWPRRWVVERNAGMVNSEPTFSSGL